MSHRTPRTDPAGSVSQRRMAHYASELSMTCSRSTLSLSTMPRSPLSRLPVRQRHRRSLVLLLCWISYDHRTSFYSRGLTSFQSPLGVLRNTSLPMGPTNSVAIFYGDVTFILEPEILNVARSWSRDQPPALKPQSGIRNITENFQALEGSFVTT